MANNTVEERLQAIEQRNQRVEMDKAWETSLARRTAIALLTYAVAGLTLVIIGAERPWLGAFVPVIGFLLSTLSLPVVKARWARRQREGNRG